MLSVPVRCATLSALRSAPHTGRILSATQSRSISKHVFDSYGDVSKGLDLPPMPSPPPLKPSLEQLVEEGQSVLSELGLFTWWKPSSYFRMALEGIHIHADIPWWLTIVSATVALRLLLIYVPIMAQRNIAEQSKYRKELTDFRERADEARKEGNNLLAQQIFLEQNDFMKSKGINVFRQLGTMMANGAVFATQFFAIKKMITVNYPGFSTGGTAWFTDLTVADPYFILPVASAVTMGVVAWKGIEFGASAETMPPAMRLGMVFGLPVFICIFSMNFGSGLVLYWVTSNTMSLIYSTAFRMEGVRKILKIPPMAKSDGLVSRSVRTDFSSAKDRFMKQGPRSMADLRAKDAQAFKSAGRGKPIIK